MKIIICLFLIIIFSCRSEVKEAFINEMKEKIIELCGIPEKSKILLEVKSEGLILLDIYTPFPERNLDHNRRISIPNSVVEKMNALRGYDIDINALVSWEDSGRLVGELNLNEIKCQNLRFSGKESSTVFLRGEYVTIEKN